MSQIVPGQIIGNPGGAVPGAGISNPLGIFYGQGSPLNATNPLITNARVASLYLDYVGGNLWIMAAGQQWTQINVP